MGVIQKRGDKYRVLIRKKGRKPISKTFPTKAIATRWMIRTEAELSDNAYKDQGSDILLSKLIERCFDEFDSIKPFGPNKSSTLNILREALGHYRLNELTTDNLLDYFYTLVDRGRSPATVQSYVVYLRGVLTAAVVDWKYNYDMTQFEAAANRLRRAGMVGKATERDRRISDEELKRICDALDARKRTKIPASTIVRFAVASAMRVSEITRLRWADYDPVKKTILVRNRKHPTNKANNHTVVPLLGDMHSIVESMPRVSPFVFPFNHESVTAAFERAVNKLGIPDLHFHDTRHEGLSRLFEQGYSAFEVMMVSGHRSVQSLKRYVNIKPEQLHQGPIRRGLLL